jgi:hypothetical protein
LAFSTGRLNLGFLLRENLLLCSSHLLLGFQLVGHLHHQHRATNKFSGAIAREKEDFCKGSFSRTSFTLF